MNWTRALPFVLSLLGTLGIAAIAQTPPSPPPSPAPTLNLDTPAAPAPSSPTRLTLKLTLTQPQDLKIKTGDRLVPGQVVADRTTERQQLQAKQDQLDLNLQHVSQPLPPIAAPPNPDFSAEEAAIVAARTELEVLKTAPLPEYRFVDPRLDPEVTQKRFEAKAAQVRAAATMNQAIANLERARHNHQQRHYEHSLNIQRQQTEQRRQQYDIAQLMAQRDQVAAQLQALSAVRSPYAGTVRRVRVLGQSDRVMNVEVVLEVADKVPQGRSEGGADWQGEGDAKLGQPLPEPLPDQGAVWRDG